MDKEKKKPAIPCTYRSLEKEIDKMLFILRNINYAVKRWEKSWDKIEEVLTYRSREIERVSKRRKEIREAIHSADGDMNSAYSLLMDVFSALYYAKHSAQEAQEE